MDRIYTPKNKGDDFTPSAYVIIGNSLGLDITLVKLEFTLGVEDRSSTAFKWNELYLKDFGFIRKIKKKWLSLPHNMPFF